ncbi:MAG: TolC family protein [Planctomycetota bacterium]
MALLNFAFSVEFAGAQLIKVAPEQRRIQVRQPHQLPQVRPVSATLPFTILTEENRQQEKLSLDEAIRVAIQNAEVIRVLGGVSAGSSGRTIYDVAISNTGIDDAVARFDPQFSINSVFNHSDPVGATFYSDRVTTSVGVNRTLPTGATTGLNINSIGSYFGPGAPPVPLDPQFDSTVGLDFRQPFMRGYGCDVNLAPVVISRIETERSYFQFKDSVQALVSSVISAYWNLVAARVEVWAREQQIEQAEFAYERAVARREEQLAPLADVAQAQSALANFRASLITARSNLILRETALRNVLGIPPSNTSYIVPTSMPVLDRINFNWDEIITIASEYRPDIIELKLVLEADRQSLILADNQAKPQFDGIANYQWDGQNGRVGGVLSPLDRGQGLNIGVNFSVPFGLRQGRANLRRQELLLVRDQANLDQAMHQMVHQLTINYRNLDQFYEQYQAFKVARQASRLNFENQIGEFLSGRREFINVLQAITDWGNAVSAEASSITQYNSELANVERETGTILETHGVRFVEERFQALGPALLGRRDVACDYPAAFSIDGTTDRYPESPDSSDDSFNLEDLDFFRESDRVPAQPQFEPQPQPMPEPFDPLEEPVRSGLAPNRSGGALNLWR